jgi:hypothetical protein
LPAETVAQGFMFDQHFDSVILTHPVGHLKRPFTSPRIVEVLSAMAMPIPPMSLSLFTAPKCVWQETRAVNRVLRKAYGIGICSVEEMGSFAEPPQSSRESKKLPPQPSNGNRNHGPKVRDRLCQLIRQHRLDPNLVKAYATDFCGVKTLREATREQVETFVARLADWPRKTAMPCSASSTAIR